MTDEKAEDILRFLEEIALAMKEISESLEQTTESSMRAAKALEGINTYGIDVRCDSRS